MTKSLFSVYAILALIFLTSPARAAVEPNYTPDKPPVTNPWYADQTPANRAADLAFIKGMRPHHAGALTMSTEYLNSKKTTSVQMEQLAKGIIHNQTFEIAMLDRVEDLVKPAVKGDSEWRQIAEQGLAQKQHFVRAPMPGFYGRGTPVSREDVRFAKAMIVHHEGALVMAKDYLADPNANNKYLRLMCTEILRDQTMEIDFMKDLIAQYPGNPDDVKIDASMIHGMEGMNHGKHGMKGHKMAPKAHETHMDHGNMHH